MEDKIPKIAGVKLVRTGSIERDRRVIGNLHSKAAALDRQSVSSVELFGVKVAGEGG
jgi:hypothetical protein